VNKETTVVWDVTLCSLSDRYNFGVICCLHLQRRQINYTEKGRKHNESSIQVSNIPIKTSVVTIYRLLCSVAYPGILFGGVGSTNSVEDRENGDLGAVAP